LQGLREKELNFTGFHVHLGSGIDSIKPYTKALSLLERAALYVHTRDFRCTTFNIGGGFGSSSAPLLKPLQLFSSLFMPGDRSAGRTSKPDFLPRLAGGLSDLLARLNRQGVHIETIIVEPGRRLSGSAQMTIITVHDIIERSSGRKCLICDGGAMSLSPMLLTEYHRLLPLVRRGKELYRYSVFGNLPSSLDKVSPSVRMPELRIGDQIAILDTGAYFISYANNFNGPRPAIVTIDGSQARLSRKREEFSDLIRNDILPTQDDP